MADASVSAEGNYQYHWIGSLYTSWLNEMRDGQVDPLSKCIVATGSGGDTNVVNGEPNCSGAVYDRTPGETTESRPGDPSWMFAYPLVLSYQHRYMADTRLTASLYPGIREYANFLKGMADRGKGKTKGLVTWKKYGDWLEPGRVPSLNIIGEMGSGFNYGQTLRIARDTATSLGHTDDAATYEVGRGPPAPKLAQIIFGPFSISTSENLLPCVFFLQTAHKLLQSVFHTAWWDPTKKTYGNGQQAALVYALYLGAVPAEIDAAVFAQLLGLINTAPQPPDHLTNATQQCGQPPCIDTGIIATKWLMELLSLRGRTDIGLDLAFQTDYPSWGYM